jgi:type IV pilus assembly protein PilA
MKKQSGFTLIELLLVLAIIGIISAIAIPALLGQRARARDKASIANLDSVIADGIGAWDKQRESGVTASTAITTVTTGITTGHSGDKNPWNTAVAAYSISGTAVTSKATASAFIATLAGSVMGTVKIAYQLPATSLPGFIGGAVLLNDKVNGSTTYRKAAAIE